MSSLPKRINHFRRRISWVEVETFSNLVTSVTSSGVSEDLGDMYAIEPWASDITTDICMVRGNGTAAFVAREDMVVCGLKIPSLYLPSFGCKDVKFSAHKEDGDRCVKGDCLGIIEGSISQILATERTLLNFMQRLSGVATKSAEFVTVVSAHDVGLLDTRKTTPGLRIFEKYATATGGSYNHRIGLYDQILIKDNHLASAGIKDDTQFYQFLRQVKERAFDRLIEVEIDDLSRLKSAIEAQVDAVLLDNFSPNEVAQAVSFNKNRIVLEASGGINLDNLEEYASARPHFISTGAPVHQATWVDIGLDWVN